MPKEPKEELTPEEEKSCIKLLSIFLVYIIAANCQIQTSIVPANFISRCLVVLVAAILTLISYSFIKEELTPEEEKFCIKLLSIFLVYIIAANYLIQTSIVPTSFISRCIVVVLTVFLTAISYIFISVTLSISDDYKFLFYQNRFVSAYMKKKYDTAIKYCNKIKKEYPGREKYIDEWQLIAEYGKKIKSCHINAENYFKRGCIYAKLELYDDAIEDFTQTIILGYNDVSVYYYRGICYANLGQYEQAIENSNKAIELNPDFEKVVYFLRGFAKVQLCHFEEGLDDINKAVEGFDTQDIAPVVHLYRSIGNFKMNNIDEAKSDLTKCFTANMTDVEKEKLGRELGIISQSDKWGNDYIEFCKSILYSYPDNELAMYLLKQMEEA